MENSECRRNIETMQAAILDLGHRTTDFLRVRGVAGSDKLAITPRYKSVEGLLELETKKQSLIAQGRLDPKSRPRILFRKEED